MTSEVSLGEACSVFCETTFMTFIWIQFINNACHCKIEVITIFHLLLYMHCIMDADMREIHFINSYFTLGYQEFLHPLGRRKWCYFQGLSHLRQQVCAGWVVKSGAGWVLIIMKGRPNLHREKLWSISNANLWVCSTTSCDPTGAGNLDNQRWFNTHQNYRDSLEKRVWLCSSWTKLRCNWVWTHSSVEIPNSLKGQLKGPEGLPKSLQKWYPWHVPIYPGGLYTLKEKTQIAPDVTVAL